MSILSSEESKSKYLERKKRVLNILAQTRDYYDSVNDHNKAEVFEKLYSNLENEEFNIVVVGEFSAGKSTMLNALMGKRILPSFSNETTATVNFLRHADKAPNGEAGIVYYNDGTSKVIEDDTLDTINKYVSTTGIDVANTVDHLDLFLDSDFLKDGVTLVDSPGLNGVADGHREITENQILKSHASIFLFSSDHPGSKTDFEFLHELQSKVNTIIFVLNKIDEIKVHEGNTAESIIDSLKKTYKAQFPETTMIPEIWPIAAYPALVARNDEPLDYLHKVHRTKEERKALEEQSRLKDFENRLMAFLTCGEKAKQQLLAPIERIVSLIRETRDEYKDELSFLQTAKDATEIEEQIAEIKKVIDQLGTQIHDSRLDVDNKLHEVFCDQKESCMAKMVKLQNNKLNEIDAFEDYEALTDYLQHFETDFLHRTEHILHSQDNELRDGIMNVIRLEYSNHVKEIQTNLSNNSIGNNLKVSEHLNTGNQILNIGLNEMKQREERLTSEWEKLKDEANLLEANLEIEKNKLKRRHSIEVEIEQLKNRKENIESMELPPINYYDVQEYDTIKRKGAFGIIAKILVGDKTVTRTVRKADSRAYDEAKSDRELRKKEVNDQIDEKKTLLAGYAEPNVEMIELQLKHIRDKETEAANKLERELHENTIKMEKKYSKELRRIKNTLRNYCETISDELSSQIKMVLNDAENEYTEIVLSIVECSLQKLLNDKQERLEQLTKQLKSSEQQRNERIEHLQEEIEKTNIILANATDLDIELANIPVDIIRTEKI